LIRISIYALLAGFGLLAYCNAARAQKDSLIAIQQLLPAQYLPQAVDSVQLELLTPSFVHRYDSLNGYLPLGNVGGYALPLSGLPVPQTGFHSAMLVKQTADDSLVYFRAPIHFSEIRYVLGQKAEQNLMITHHQRITQQVAVTARYHKINTQGFYSNQKLNSDRLMMSALVNVSERYHVRGGVIYRRLQRQDNGGIASDSDFRDIGFQNKELLAVRLGDVTIQQATVQTPVEQWFRIGKQLALWHSGRFAHVVRTHFDSQLDTAIYPGPLYSELESFNKTEQTGTDHVAGLRFNTGRWSAQAGYRLQAGILKSNFTRWFYQNHGVDAGFYHVSGSRINAVWWLNGYNAGDMDLSGRWVQRDSVWRVVAQGRFARITPAPDQQRYRSNTHTWNEDFSPTRFADGRASVCYQRSGTTLNLGYRLTEGLVWFDTLGKPHQTMQYIHQVQVKALQQFKVGAFRANLWLMWQPVWGSEAVAMPELMAGARCWWQLGIFKGKMQSLIGLEGSWFSAWNAYAYEPVTDQLLVQTSVTVGNFPLFGAFLNARVSQAEFFVSVTNLTAGLLPNNYYAAYRYPLADRSVKLGIRWQFYN
jgi:hypothetical protein